MNQTNHLTISQPARKLYLLDGSALVYRSYYAFIRNPLINSHGKNISAVYGFINTVLKIWREEKPDLIAIVFDERKPTFRHEMYSDYKANREAMPEELVSQIPLISEFIEKATITRISKPGYEADDIIAFLSRKATLQQIHTCIVSGDKDLLQLIGDYVTFFNVRAISKSEEKKMIGPEDVIEKYGIPHTAIADFLALTGDTSDNIPGVYGIGEKTASRLIQQYNDIENLYAHIDEVKQNSLKDKLIKGKENAFLSKQLVTLHQDIPLDTDPKELKSPEALPPELLFWLDEHEFPSLKRYVENQPSEKKAVKKKEYFFQEIKDFTHLKQFLESLQDNIYVSISSQESNELLFLSDGTLHGGVLGDDLKNDPRIRDIINEWFSGSVTFIGYDIKRIMRHFLKLELSIPSVFYDVCLAGFLLDPEKKNPALKDLVKRYLGENDHLVSAESQDMQSLIENGIACFSLHLLFKRLIEEKNMTKLYNQIESPLIRVLAQMEHDGTCLNILFLENFKNEILIEIQTLSKAIMNFAGEEFNINSPQQLGEILFQKLEIHKEYGIKKVKKTKTGYSTSFDTLVKYQALPIVQAILRYRLLAKLLNTYIDSLIQCVHPDTKRIHASFNQMVTVTGRLSSSGPNLQNIPIKTEEGAKIRRAFIASESHVLLSADYSQIELRILAHLSVDPVMIAAFEKNRDIHSETASRIFNIPLEHVSQEQRNRAKAVNFGVIYGMGPYKLSQDTGITIPEASRFIEQYFDVYQGVKEYIDCEIQKVRETGITKNLFGRIRALPEINSLRKDRRIMAEHMAINTPIQGTAADLIKLAMIRINEKIRTKKIKARLLLQIHDELLFEVPEDNLKEIQIMVRSEMENVMLLRIPLIVTMGAGRNWLEAH